MGSWAGDYALTEASRKDLEAKVPAEVLQSILTLAVTTEARRLFFKPVGQSRSQVFRAEDGVLFTKRSGIELTAEAGSRPAAPVKSLTLKQRGLQMHYERSKAGAKKKTPAKR